MKIKTKDRTYEQVAELKPYESGKPIKQWAILRWLIRIISIIDLIRVKFTFSKINMDKLGKKEPCLILMNHSSFLDLKIIARVFWDRPYQIVCTMDAMMGKNWIMKLLGCIPTKKFTIQPKLIKDMLYAVNDLKSSVVMYPEAGYSFDGTATTLPESLGKCIKLMKVPVVMVKSHGAFLWQPLYNNLHIRKVQVHADVEYILSQEDIAKKSVDEINEIIAEQFSFDHFRWQQDNEICIKHKQRAEGLNRILYKCAACHMEGRMDGKGTEITCKACGKTYELTETGYLKALADGAEMKHIPDWYTWERECVRREIEKGEYLLDIPVYIYVMIDTKAVYYIGEGRLKHSIEGFQLDSDDGKLQYMQAPEKSYSLNSDFYWYEKGDVIGLGDKNMQFYCMPKNEGDVVAKARLATEEIYKMVKNKARCAK